MELQTNGQYWFDKDDIINNSEITETDLTDLYGEQLERSIELANRRVYQILYSASPNVHRERNIPAINYMIQQDTDLQDVMQEAVIEYVRGALYSGMDLREYVSGDKIYSRSMIDLFKQSGLWIVGEIQYIDSDIE